MNFDGWGLYEIGMAFVGIAATTVYLVAATAFFVNGFFGKQEEE